MQNHVIAFIGAGHMARSLIGGLLADGYDPTSLWVSDISSVALQALAQDYGVHTTTANEEAARQATVIVLAVKPQVLQGVAREIASVAQTQCPLVISIAAGMRLDDIARWLGPGAVLVRAMPNTPALLRTGATALYAGAGVTPAQRDVAESILRAVGLTLWIDDELLMDTVTALSGSGPAYFFLLMEALTRAGEDLGLPSTTARLLTLQTAYGAAKMALESQESPAILRHRVTSPGGTTEQAIQRLEQGHFNALIAAAVQAAQQRGIALAEQLGKDA